MIELLEQQEKLTANQWKLIVTGNLADLLDFFDFFLIGYVLAFINQEWQLTYWQGAVILLSSGIGAVPGAFFWGWVADKIGRRKVFILTALNVALATGIMALTPGPNGWISGWLFLAVFRLFVGVGNAGLYAVDMPLVQEFMPTKKRGWVGALITTLLPAGSMLGGVAALAGADGTARGGAQIARVGADGRSEGDRPADDRSRGREGVVVGIVQIPPQRHRRLPGRADPDRRRRAWAVGRDPVRAGAQDLAGRCSLPDDLREHV